MRKIIFIIYFILLLIPGYTILGGGALSYNFRNPENIVYLFLRLAALYGVTLLFTQMILGSFMQKFTSVFGGRALAWHIRQGIITYGIVLSHPLLYTVYTAQTLNFFNPIKTVWPNFSDLNEYYISFGRLGLYLLTIGVFFGIFRSHKFLIKNWRKFHIINYLAFASILFHSWNVGSDTHTPPFVFLYPVFIAGLVVALSYRRVYRVIKELRQPLKKVIVSS